MIEGYKAFRERYATGDGSIMRRLSEHGQQPEIMVVACSDSRVDPTLILQCDPGELFTVRNVANIIPPFEKDEKHHGTSAALEFGICHLNVKHLILLGHSQCGGMQALLSGIPEGSDDFISAWVSAVDLNKDAIKSADELSQASLIHSYKNCLSFPWIKERIEQNKLKISLWYFDIKKGEIQAYNPSDKKFHPLS